MPDVTGRTLELFSSLNNLRKAWHSIRPSEVVSKSLFVTLMAIAHSQDKSFLDYQPVKLVEGCIAVSDLASIMHVSLSVASQRVRALEELQLLRREIDLHDRRVCRVALTKKGNLLVKQAHNNMKNIMDATLKDFGEENIPTLIGMLDRLSTCLENAQFSDEANQSEGEENI